MGEDRVGPVVVAAVKGAPPGERRAAHAIERVQDHRVARPAPPKYDFSSRECIEHLLDEGRKGGDDNDCDLSLVAEKERRLSQPGGDDRLAGLPGDVRGDQVEVPVPDVVKPDAGVRQGIVDPVQKRVLCGISDRQCVPVDHV